MVILFVKKKKYFYQEGTFIVIWSTASMSGVFYGDDIAFLWRISLKTLIMCTDLFCGLYPIQEKLLKYRTERC